MNGGIRARRAASVLILVTAAWLGVAGCNDDRSGSADPGAGASRANGGATVEAVTEPSAKPPVVTHRLARNKEEVPFATRVRDSASLKKGVTKVDQVGRPGLRVKVYRITLKDGVESGRKLISNKIARPAVSQIKLRGTRVDPPPQQPSCDPNYSGSCVPVASDVDCGGGSGDGPAYVSGSVRVVGADIYDLDRDGDGYGCD